MIFSISVIDLVGRCARMSLRRWRVGTPAVRGRHRHFHPPEPIPALEDKGSWSIPAFMIPRERWNYPWRRGKSWIIWGYRWSFLVGLIWWELHVCILNWCVVLIVSLIIKLLLNSLSRRSLGRTRWDPTTTSFRFPRNFCHPVHCSIRVPSPSTSEVLRRSMKWVSFSCFCLERVSMIGVYPKDTVCW